MMTALFARRKHIPWLAAGFAALLIIGLAALALL